MSKLLITDLDGTFIPFECEASVRALSEFRNWIQQGQLRIVYATGRHPDSVFDAIVSEKLPIPEAIICNVGSTILRSRTDGLETNSSPSAAELKTMFVESTDYENELGKLSGLESFDNLNLENELETHALGLRKQEPFKQSRFKLSFYCKAMHLEETAELIRHQLSQASITANVLASVDPFNNDGLIDVLPPNVDKSYAVRNFVKQNNIAMEDYVYAGDSGNDLAVLTSGCQSVLVGNATRQLRRQIQSTLAGSSPLELLYCARQNSTAGVLAGCRFFNIIS